jgi:hypothetical protein
MEWMTIPNFSRYEINLQGQVRNIRTKQILSQRLDKKGYYVLALTNDNEARTTKALHRLLMETFKPVEGMDALTVHHINHIKDDNRLENLQWLTNSENIKEAFEAGIFVGKIKGGNNKKSVRCIETGEIFESSAAAARHVGIASRGKIGDAIKNPNKTCGGYHWALAE